MNAVEDTISDLGFTTKQIARKLNRDPKTIERMRKRGNGPPFIYHNKQVYYPFSEYYAWLSSAMASMQVSTVI